MTTNRDIVIAHASSGDGCDEPDTSLYYATPEQLVKMQELMEQEEADDNEDFELVSNYIEEIEKNDLTKIKVGFSVTIDSYYGSYASHNIGLIKPLPL